MCHTERLYFRECGCAFDHKVIHCKSAEQKGEECAFPEQKPWDPIHGCCCPKHCAQQLASVVDKSRANLVARREAAMKAKLIDASVEAHKKAADEAEWVWETMLDDFTPHRGCVELAIEAFSKHHYTPDDVKLAFAERFSNSGS